MKLQTKLSILKIRDEADSNERFTKGVRYYQEDRVKNPKIQELSDKEIISAKVVGSGKEIYNASVKVDREGNILTCHCNCSDYSESNHMCEHILAVLLYRFYHTDTREYQGAWSIPSPPKNNTITTDIRIKSLINRYVSDDVAKGGNYVAVKAVPRLELYENAAFLGLTIGRTRQYVVKNIESFCKNIKMRNTVAYGKELEFFHHISAFDKESQNLIQFILNKQEEKERYIGGTAGSGYRYGYSGYGLDGEKKFIRLTPPAMDELFELLNGEEISIGSFGSQPVTTFLEDFTPDFSIEIKEVKGQDGYELTLPDCQYVLGQRHLYLFCDDESDFGLKHDINNTLCRFNQEVSQKLAGLVDTLSGKVQSLSIAKADMPSFCVNVLSELENVLTIKGDIEKINQYIPEELTVKMYFDSPHNDEVTALVKYQYGEVEFDPYGDKIPSLGIIRNEKQERRIQMALGKYFNFYDSEKKLWYLQGSDEKLYHFVTDGIEEMARLGEVFASDRFKNMGVKRPSQMSIGVRLESNLLKIDIDTKELPLNEVMDALQQYNLKRKYYRLKDGGFLKLEEEGFSELAEMIEGLGLSKKELSLGKISVPKYRAMYLDGLFKNSKHVNFERNGNFKSLIKNMKNIDDSELTVPKELTSIMRNYQKYGYQWLSVMDECGFGGILADDMGLGKTLQMISLILAKKEQGEEHQALVVCPASLVLNWKNEIDKFAPTLVAEAIIGNLSERKELLSRMDEYDVIITSYDLLKRDIDFYKDNVFRYQIIDEAQYIKNHGTQNAKAVKLIQSKQRFALTGTPVENRLSELWSIFDFLMPLYLSTYPRFKDRFETEIVKNGNGQKLQMLSRLVSPFMLRRLKGNVLKELPEKVESVVYMQMEGEQKKLYLANLMKTKEELTKGLRQNKFETNKIAILAMLTRLRQICCHPALCYDDYKEGSAKMESCIELLMEAAGGGHKVLLFSQFTTMLELIRARLEKENISYYMLTGSTPKEERIDLVDKFNDNRVQVFLISLKAGGTGLNLTGADVVIHYDPWWNIAAQNQATDRTHRIGQKNSVQVYKLIEKGTIEEKILNLQEKKKDLADAIVKDDMAGITAMSREELLELLEL